MGERPLVWLESGAGLCGAAAAAPFVPVPWRCRWRAVPLWVPPRAAGGPGDPRGAAGGAGGAREGRPRGPAALCPQAARGPRAGRVRGPRVSALRAAGDPRARAGGAVAGPSWGPAVGAGGGARYGQRGRCSRPGPAWPGLGRPRLPRGTGRMWGGEN